MKRTNEIFNKILASSHALRACDEALFYFLFLFLVVVAKKKKKNLFFIYLFYIYNFYFENLIYKWIKKFENQ